MSKLELGATIDYLTSSISFTLDNRQYINLENSTIGIVYLGNTNSHTTQLPFFVKTQVIIDNKMIEHHLEQNTVYSKLINHRRYGIDCVLEPTQLYHTDFINLDIAPSEITSPKDTIWQAVVYVLPRNQFPIWYQLEVNGSTAYQNQVIVPQTTKPVISMLE